MSVQVAESLKKMEEEILSDARKTAEKKLEEAQREADKFLERAKAEASREAEEIKRKAAENATILERRRMSEARRELSLKVLAEKNAMVEKAFEEAKKRLQAISGSEQYYRSLRRLLEAAIGSLGLKEAKVLLNEADLKKQSQIVKELRRSELNLIFERAPKDISGGFILTSLDGRVVLDNSLDSRLEAAERSLKREVAKILFG